MSLAAAYLRLIRPANCIMMGVAVLIGAVMAGIGNLNATECRLALGFITGFALTGASMVVNDYYDRKIDAINEPHRPIPSGKITPSEALIFATILTIVGFAAAVFTNALCILVSIIAWLLLAAYTTFGKRAGLPGNFLVSSCIAIPFVYGSLAITGTVGLNVIFFAGLAFLSNTGREITKGIVDAEGDKAENVRTLAVGYGSRKAALVAASFYLSAVVISPLPWLLRLVSIWFLPFVVLTDFGLALSSFLLLRNSSRENARKVKNAVLLWFIAGLTAFVVGAIG